MLTTKETHQQMPNLENKKRELQEKRYLQRKPEQFLLTEEGVRWLGNLSREVNLRSAGVRKKEANQREQENYTKRTGSQNRNPQ